MSLKPVLTTLCLLGVVPLLADAAPPDNPGQQRRNPNQIERNNERGRDRAQQRRETRGRPESPGRSNARNDRGRPDKGRPENPGNGKGKNQDKETGSARSQEVSKGQNRLAKTNADRILVKRLAQIDHIRDVAIANGNEKLLEKADAMEAAVRADHERRTGVKPEPSEPSEPTQ